MTVEGNLPDDSCFIWNRHVLEGRSFFFNPFLTHLHGAELAMRIHKDHVWHRTDPFFVIDQNQYMSPVGETWRNLCDLYIAPGKTAAANLRSCSICRKLEEESAPSEEKRQSAHSVPSVARSGRRTKHAAFDQCFSEKRAGSLRGDSD